MATLIQSYLRRRSAIRLVNLKLSYRAKIVRIQRFIKRWCKKKRQMAVVIQARLREVRAKRKVAKFLKITRGARKLLKLYQDI